jgi:hypothetical protein
MNINVSDIAAARVARQNRRAWWMKQLRTWHWISGALCLVAMLLFAVTGITLNHAAQIEGKPLVVTKDVTAPAAVVTALQAGPVKGRTPVPEAVAAWIATTFSASAAGREVEWSDGEAYVSLTRPGGDAWVQIDRESGEAKFESTDRGWIAYLNDLHKGRNTGVAWSWFIDVFAVACVLFCATGLLLLQLYAKGRPSTWPVVGFGLGLPIVLAILFIH